MADYAWSHAVISDETHRIIGNTCDFDSNDPWSNDECSQAVDEMLNQYKEIDIYSLYTSVCIANLTNSENLSQRQVISKRSSKMVMFLFSFLPNPTTNYKSLFHLNLILYIRMQMPRIMGGYDPCLDEYTEAFYNRADVQRALHVTGHGHKLRKWSICK